MGSSKYLGREFLVGVRLVRHSVPFGVGDARLNEFSNPGVRVSLLDFCEFSLPPVVGGLIRSHLNPPGGADGQIPQLDLILDAPVCLPPTLAVGVEVHQISPWHKECSLLAKSGCRSGQICQSNGGD